MNEQQHHNDEPAEGAAGKDAERNPTDGASGDRPSLHEPHELPRQYGADRMLLMPRDPNWLYALWEVTEQRRQSALGELNIEAEAAKALLRVHDVTDLEFDRTSGQPDLAKSEDFFTIDVTGMEDHWHIRVERPGRLYCVEYLLVAPEGRTVSLVRSNLAATPVDRVSEITDETWLKGPPRAKPVASTTGPAQTKWLKGQEHTHEGLSSPGSAKQSSE